MIRVLHFASIINGGDFIDTALNRLDSSRFDVSALTGVAARRRGNGQARYPNRTLHLEFTRRTYPKMLLALLKEIRGFRPHILHAHHYDESLVGSLARRAGGVPCYVIGHHYSDHIYVLTRGLKRRVVLAGETFSQKVATRIVVPSQHVSRILTQVQDVPSRKVTVVPYGFETEVLRPSSPEAPRRVRRELGLEDKYVAMTCCRLNREKGLQYLLQAVPQVRSWRNDFRLVLVGSGPFEPTLRDWCRRLAIEEVVYFAGWQDQALDWMAAADLVLQPSLSESFCQTLVEALALAKPVIMTPVGAAPEIIGDNQRGRLVPVGRVDELAAAIGELMRNRALADQLGRSGRDFVRGNLSAGRMARRYEEIYLEALRESLGEQGWETSST